MARTDFGYLPRENPCAQCGKPIATPDWIESGPNSRRLSLALLGLRLPIRGGGVFRRG